MAKCPNCNKDIDALYMSRLVRADINMSYNVSILNGALEVTHMDERDDEPEVRDTLSEEYSCPICEEVILGISSIDEAFEFLSKV